MYNWIALLYLRKTKYHKSTVLNKIFFKKNLKADFIDPESRWCNFLIADSIQ